MDYIKDDLHNTILPTLIIEEKKRYKDYPQIGFGDEGSVHRYNDKIAFKTFDFISDKEKLPRKFEKIELLGQLHDKAACFPIGLVGYEDEKKEEYYYDLVNPNENFKDFDYLSFLKDMKLVLEYIIKADEAIQRFHKMGIIIGDIKGDNIMIDANSNVKFIDTDNWKYGDYDFDVIPGRSEKLNRIYNKDFPLIDNDRFVFAMMAIQYFIKGDVISMHSSDEYFKKLIEYMNVSINIKEGLRLIFSDSLNKPYIGHLLKEINPEEEIISEEAVYKLIRIF